MRRSPSSRPPLLDKRWRKLREGGEGIGDHSFEALHELRLEAKRLRYAAELFAPLWGGKAARRFLKRLAALQEALGTVNDAAVARGCSRRSTAAPRPGRRARWRASPRRARARAESALARWDDVAGRQGVLGRRAERGEASPIAVT